MPLSLAVMIKVVMTAARSAPRSEPANSQDLRPRAKPRKARYQQFLDNSGLWPAIAGGCTCSRDTVGEFRLAGMEVTGLRDMAVGPDWGHTNPHIIGTATPG